MRSPSYTDNNFNLPNQSTSSSKENAANDELSSTNTNEPNEPDDSRPPTINLHNDPTKYSKALHNNDIALHFPLPTFVKPSAATSLLSTSLASSISSSDSSLFSSSLSSASTSPGYFKPNKPSILSTSISSSASNSNSSSRSSSESSSPTQHTHVHSHKSSIFIKRYLNDKDSKEGIYIDDMIKKLIYLNTTQAPAKQKKQAFPFHSWEIQLVCSVVREIFLNQPTLLRLQAPIKIVGDLHGQFNDLLRILKLSGLPSETNYLFLGDYVDRGKQSLETILLLLCYKIKYPNNFFMLRGNHESANVTKMYGFYDECKRRKSTKVWKSFIDVFNCLPLAATINDKIFCIHGGISPDLKSLNQINNDIVRPTDIPDEGLITDLLWSDPDSTVKDWSLNDRGVSYTFSKNNVLDFCSKFKFDLIIRGHMVVEDGYEFFAKKKLVTVFSAPNYCGQFQNWGAVLSINTGLMCSFELLKPHRLKRSKS